MKTEIEYGLEGQFRVQIYSGKTLVEDTDFFNNFITPGGRFYPSIYPFADCFRFLSIGSDTSTPNNGGVSGVSGNATTGLAAPILSYGTNLGNQSGTWIGWPGYENGTDGSASACGTTITEQGPRLYRAWILPSGTNGNIQNVGGALIINEFMVSPSSGNDPTGCCAFSRVRRTVTIPNGYSAIISYQLSINLQNTGLTYFAPGTFTTGNADVTSDSTDALIVSGWGNLSGYYRQCNHGLAIINSAGAHDVAPFNCGMEPSLTNLSNYTFYLSPDNSQFDVNNVTGGIQSNFTGAYQSDGVLQSIYGYSIPQVTTTSLTDNSFYGQLQPPGSNLITNWNSSSINNAPVNIRVGTSQTNINVPSVSNYSSGDTILNGLNYQLQTDASIYDVSYANPGSQLINTSKVNFKQSVINSARIFALPIDMTQPGNNITGRTKSISRKTLFSPVSSLGYNTRFGSLVFAYNTSPGTPGSNFYWPYIDTLFFDTSGRSLMQHYRTIEVVLDNRGSGIADAYITISPNGTNINRFISRKTYQGPYDSVDMNTSGFDINNTLMQNSNIQTAWTDGTNQFPSYVPLSGNAYSNNISGSGIYLLNNNGVTQLTNSGCSGWGMVYGIIADNPTWYQTNQDVGLVNHNVTGISGNLSVTPVPNETGALYWPNTNTAAGGTQLILSITGIRYWSNGTCFNGVPGPISSGNNTGFPNYSGSSAGHYNWLTNPCNFCPPTGHILHHEHFGQGVSGYRLLPNYGVPNNNGNNYYPSLTGGALPATSFDNGLELYQIISYTTPCSDAVNCV